MFGADQCGVTKLHQHAGRHRRCILPAAESAYFVARRDEVMIFTLNADGSPLYALANSLAAFSVPRSLVNPLLSLVSITLMRSKPMIVIGSDFFHNTFSPRVSHSLPVLF